MQSSVFLIFFSVSFDHFTSDSASARAFVYAARAPSYFSWYPVIAVVDSSATTACRL